MPSGNVNLDNSYDRVPYPSWHDVELFQRISDECQIKAREDRIRIGGQPVSDNQIDDLLLRQVQTSLEKRRRAALLVS